MADKDYSKVMDLYKKLSAQGLKTEADKVMGALSSKYGKNAQAPPVEIQKGLEGIVKKHAKPTVKPATAYDYAGLAIAAMILLYLV